MTCAKLFSNNESRLKIIFAFLRETCSLRRDVIKSLRGIKDVIWMTYKKIQ